MKVESDRPLRFFFHYHKGRDGMTVHFRGKCLVCDDVRCYEPCESKWNKEQPRLVMQGFTRRVETHNEQGHITITIGTPP